jgi:hypothetical protein
MFLTKVVQKIKTHILCSVAFFRKSCRLWDNVEKYGTAGQATDDNIIRRMRFACWITKTTDTRARARAHTHTHTHTHTLSLSLSHTEYVILIAFPRQQGLRERASMLCLYVHCLSCLLLLLSTFYKPFTEIYTWAPSEECCFQRGSSIFVYLWCTRVWLWDIRVFI